MIDHPGLPDAVDQIVMQQVIITRVMREDDIVDHVIAIDRDGDEIRAGRGARHDAAGRGHADPVEVGRRVTDPDPWRCSGCGARFAVPSLAREHERECVAVPRGVQHG